MATTDAADDPLPETWSAFVAPDWTAHALERWDERMPAAAVAPETALDESVPVHDTARPLFRTGSHDTPDEVRVYVGDADGQRFGAVLVIEHRPTSDVVTTYRIASRHDRSLRAYCWARFAEGPA